MFMRVLCRLYCSPSVQYCHDHFDLVATFKDLNYYLCFQYIVGYYCLMRNDAIDDFLTLFWTSCNFIEVKQEGHSSSPHSSPLGFKNHYNSKKLICGLGFSPIVFSYKNLTVSGEHHILSGCPVRRADPGSFGFRLFHHWNALDHSTTVPP